MRIRPLEEAELSPAQKEIWDRLVAGPRGDAGVAHRIWLRNPAIAAATEALGTAIRFHAMTPARRELAVMLMARRLRCNRIWAMHRPVALKAGLPGAWLEAIAAGSRPDYGDAAFAAIHDMVETLDATRRVPEPLYARAVAALGEAQLVDLVALMGLYWMTAALIETFGIEPPADAPAPFGA